MKLYLFNPDTDLALASNQPYYMASAAVRQMANDLALLPLWYAEESSGVLANSAYNAEFIQKMNALFLLDVSLITPTELGEGLIKEVMPWGWNQSLCRFLLQSGMDETVLPNTDQLANWRTLSSREISAVFLTLLTGEHYFSGEAKILRSAEDCKNIFNQWRNLILKTPWSSSGKGLKWCHQGYNPSIEKWCSRNLKEQGCLVASPIYNRIVDFAMEFYVNGRGEVRWLGYSLFETNQNGAYLGNKLMSDVAIEQILGHYVTLDALLSLRRNIQQLLQEKLAVAYKGPLGLDMMICRDESSKTGYFLHPCVEMNLRMNMGILAHTLYQKFVEKGKTGSLQVKHYPSNSDLKKEVQTLQENNSLLIKNGRIVSGFLPLVPVTPTSRNLAYVLVDA